MIVVLVSQVDPGLSLRSAFLQTVERREVVSRGAVYRLLFQRVGSTRSLCAAVSRWINRVDHRRSARRWSRDGKELFYVEGDTLMAAKVTTTPSFSFSPPPLFQDPIWSHLIPVGSSTTSRPTANGLFWRTLWRVRKTRRRPSTWSKTGSPSSATASRTKSPETNNIGDSPRKDVGKS